MAIEMHRDKRFECPRWPIATDLVWLHRLIDAGAYFLAHPIKQRRQGLTIHQKTRDRQKLERVAHGED